MFKFEDMIHRTVLMIIMGALLCQEAQGQGFLPLVPEIRDLQTGAALTQEEAVTLDLRNWKDYDTTYHFSL